MTLKYNPNSNTDYQIALDLSDLIEEKVTVNQAVRQHIIIRNHKLEDYR